MFKTLIFFREKLVLKADLLAALDQLILGLGFNCQLFLEFSLDAIVLLLIVINLLL